MLLAICCVFLHVSLFFSNVPATPELYPLSLHDALPISASLAAGEAQGARERGGGGPAPGIQIERTSDRRQQWARQIGPQDRKSTRLNSSHRCISYAVFCLKKKKKRKQSKRQK